MDTKANLSNRKKINELAAQHNKLTTSGMRISYDLYKNKQKYYL